MKISVHVHTHASMTIAIISFVCSLLLLAEPSELTKLETVHFNKFLPNNNMGSTSYYTFDTLLKVSIKGCIKGCQSTEGCENINYERRYVRCNLLRRNENINNEDTILKLETKPGLMFGNKSEWTKVNLIDCDHCKQNEDCVKKMENATYFCKITVCERPKNSLVRDNVFTPGSKIVHACKEFYTKIPRKVQLNKATCLKNGTWDNGFACLKGEEFNGSFYHINTQLMTWFEAQDYCLSVFGHLVDIETEDEQFYISELVGDYYKTETWTGGNDLETTGTYVWSDGTEMTYTYWLPGRPDIIYEHCVQLQYNYPGWNNVGCLNHNQVMCEMP